MLRSPGGFVALSAMASAPKKRSNSKKAPGASKASGTRKKTKAKKVSKNAKDAASPLKKLLERMRKLAELPENQDAVWLVELVIPPGSFIARRVAKPVNREALSKEIDASARALRTGDDPERQRFLITYTDVGGVARQYAKAMCEDIPNPAVPMPPYDRFTIEAILHAQFIGDEEY